ncbi:MAG: penicillin-binding protein 2 [Nitrospiraceae bacterium]|nr:penicillin-binding protein 2 [Nitrospiraceae bacterium]
MNRGLLLGTVIAFGFFVVLARLAGLMLVDHDWLSAKASSQYLRERAIEVKRGGIYDRQGRELAVSLDAESLYCYRGEVARPRAVAREVSEATGMKYAGLLREMTGPGGRRFIWLRRKLTRGEAARLGNLKSVRGLGFTDEIRRYYPAGVLASQVLGYLNIDNKAMAGLERQYNSTLMNKGGEVVVERDATGKVLSEGVQMESAGGNIVLTIDEGLQYIAETALDEAMKKWKAQSASLIMMDPYTGAILAMAGRPTFNPNDPGDFGAGARKNRAITDLYEPGSVFKIVTGTAALESGIVTPDSLFDCHGGVFKVGGRTFHDVEKNGVLTFEQIIEKSSNVGTIQVALKLGPDRFHRYARLLGFGRATGIDLPWEAGGRLEYPRTDVSLASNAIGYGVAVTPLQILRAYSVIANGGYLVTPHVVSRITASDGQVISSFRCRAKRVLAPETAAVFKNILSLVTQKGGTAPAAAVAGNEVSGKTGTARLFDPRTGRYSDKYSSTFVGFVPASGPKIAMIVVFKAPEGAIYGGTVAGPVFSDVAAKALAYLHVPFDNAGLDRVGYLKGDGHAVIYTP